MLVRPGRFAPGFLLVVLSKADFRRPPTKHPGPLLWTGIINAEEGEGFEPSVPHKGTTVFETAPFNHSGTPPFKGRQIYVGFASMAISGRSKIAEDDLQGSGLHVMGCVGQVLDITSVNRLLERIAHDDYRGAGAHSISNRTGRAKAPADHDGRFTRGVN